MQSNNVNGYNHKKKKMEMQCSEFFPQNLFAFINEIFILCVECLWRWIVTSSWFVVLLIKQIPNSSDLRAPIYTPTP